MWAYDCWLQPMTPHNWLLLVLIAACMLAGMRLPPGACACLLPLAIPSPHLPSPLPPHRAWLGGPLPRPGTWPLGPRPSAVFTNSCLPLSVVYT